MEFKDRLRKALEESGSSVQEIADSCDMTKQAIHKLLEGHSKSLSMENLPKMARALQINAAWLGWEEGEMRGGWTPLPVSDRVLAFALRLDKLPKEKQDAVIQIGDTLRK